MASSILPSASASRMAAEAASRAVPTANNSEWEKTAIAVTRIAVSLLIPLVSIILLPTPIALAVTGIVGLVHVIDCFFRCISADDSIGGSATMGPRPVTPLSSGPAVHVPSIYRARRHPYGPTGFNPLATTRRSATAGRPHVPVGTELPAAGPLEGGSLRAPSYPDLPGFTGDFPRVPVGYRKPDPVPRSSDPVAERREVLEEEAGGAHPSSPSAGDLRSGASPTRRSPAAPGPLLPVGDGSSHEV